MTCGCEKGKTLCDTAVNLWQSVGVAYNQAKESGNWEMYDKIRAEYEAHAN